MASTYKTPGVYVEEIAKFPPSVAPVATAIPAFIGYTEKGQAAGGEPVPTRISSLLEYERIFGGASSPKIDSIDTVNIENTTFTNLFHLYNSLQLYFANGGGPCYIVSIGNYSAADVGDFNKGIKALLQYDEPTLLVFPDAVLLDVDDLKTVQQNALEHCALLQDRFVIMDVQEDKGLREDAQTFRNKIGINNLNYGAAYAPYLQSGFGYRFSYKDVKGNGYSSLVVADPNGKIAEVQAQLDALYGDDTNKKDLQKLKFNDFSISGSSIDVGPAKKFDDLVDLFLDAKDEVTFKDVVNFLFELADKLDSLGYGTGKLDHSGGLDGIDSGLLEDSQGVINSTLVNIIQRLIDIDSAADDVTLLTYSAKTPISWESSAIPTTPSTPTKYDPFPSTGSPAEILQAALPDLRAIFSGLLTIWQQLKKAANTYYELANQELLRIHPGFRNLISQLNGLGAVLPPSGAIAGVYARVDRERGVWKAPANVSVNGLTRRITDADQEDLNVDATSGKSINAIRAFTGKGILVWGSRTLAGNDNEWRYVPVRRFFIFAEESIRKATAQFVFEPNDRNTWVRVRAMIENFLRQQWRAGALAGSTPEQAFYVRLGIPETMDATDVLEGRMIIEIGMAVVRPAEFIVLRFSHKMQES